MEPGTWKVEKNKIHAQPNFSPSTSYRDLTCTTTTTAADQRPPPPPHNHTTAQTPPPGLGLSPPSQSLVSSPSPSRGRHSIFTLPRFSSCFITLRRSTNIHSSGLHSARCRALACVFLSAPTSAAPRSFTPSAVASIHSVLKTPGRADRAAIPSLRAHPGKGFEPRPPAALTAMDKIPKLRRKPRPPTIETSVDRTSTDTSESNVSTTAVAIDNQRPSPIIGRQPSTDWFKGKSKTSRKKSPFRDLIRPSAKRARESSPAATTSFGSPQALRVPGQGGAKFPRNQTHRSSRQSPIDPEDGNMSDAAAADPDPGPQMPLFLKLSRQGELDTHVIATLCGI